MNLLAAILLTPLCFNPAQPVSQVSCYKVFTVPANKVIWIGNKTNLTVNVHKTFVNVSATFTNGQTMKAAHPLWIP